MHLTSVPHSPHRPIATTTTTTTATSTGSSYLRGSFISATTLAMTTPWVSRPKWTCKYCNVTINDDVPSRMQHENGLRHKGNVERSLRDAYRKSERERAEEREAKRTMEKIERLARESHAKDTVGSTTSATGAGPSIVAPPVPATPSGAVRKADASKPPPQWKPTDRLATYGSALPTCGEEQARLEEQRLQEWQQAEEERGKEGKAGEWQVVTPAQPVASKASRITSSTSTQHPTAQSSQIREKQGNYRSDEDDDGLEEIKVKKRMRTANENERERREAERQRTMLPTWKPMRIDTGVSVKQEGVQTVSMLKMGGEREVWLDGEDDEQVERQESGEIKQERVTDSSDKPTDSPSPSSSMFKKRKTGAGSGAKKVRAVI